MTRGRLALAGFLLTFLCACSSDATLDASSEPQPSPELLLGRAASATGLLETLHFRLEHENGTSPLPLGLRLVTAEGDVGAPNRLKARVRAKSGSLNIDVDVTSVNDRTWITNPFSRQVQELPGANLRDITDPLALLAVLTRELRDVRVVGREKLDGVETYHLTGTIDSSRLDSVLPVEPGHSVEAEIWIGRDDSLPRRLQLNGAVASGQAEGQSPGVEELSR